jgi:hypothetical protein
MAIGLLEVSKGFNIPRVTLKHHVRKKGTDGKKYKNM